MSTQAPIIYQIAVPVPLRKAFDYSSNLTLENGSRVLVPFGKRELVGIVIGTSAASEIKKIKSVSKRLHNDPVFVDSMQTLLLWASRYYHHPIGEVMSAALPVLLRHPLEDPAPAKQNVYQRIAQHDVDDFDKKRQQLDNAPAQLALYRRLADDATLDTATLANVLPGWRSAIKGLCDKGLVEKKQILILRNGDAVPAAGFELTAEQQTAATAIIDSLGGFSPFLLQGITGSGKTEVYLEAARKAIAGGKQVLFLVPEISLTPQLVSRVRAQLGPNVYAMHSGMTDRERYQSWWMAKEGLATAILGTRSAVFCRLNNPGLIIVDEEHDQSYKQQDGFRYHARDLAIKRASIEQLPVVLGSATPSLESLHNVAARDHTLLTLTKRVGTAKLPAIQILDTNKHVPENGVSPPMLNAIASRLERNEQVIVYINRRGYAPVVHCYECQWQSVCEQCSARLTYHRARKQFRCHHCGHRERAQEQCPQCATPLFFGGAGTQRVEQALLGRFPHARFTRLDRDQANTTRKLYEQLEAIRKHEVDIVVGTQLITKGHDFAKVSLVCVVNADQGLFSGDFRAPELMFQQLLQVAGRAGRADGDGEVLIQTAHPGNPYIQMLRQHDYPRFANSSLAERREALYPPFCYFALLRSESGDLNAAMDLLKQVEQVALQYKNQLALTRVEVFSPVPSPMERLSGRFRVQLLIRSQARKQLHQLLAPLTNAIEKLKYPRHVRWSLDVDPMDMS